MTTNEQEAGPQRIVELKAAKALERGDRVYFEVVTGDGAVIPLTIDATDLEKAVVFLIQCAQGAVSAQAKAGRVVRKTGAAQTIALSNADIQVGIVPNSNMGALSIDLIAMRLSVMCPAPQLRSLAKGAAMTADKIEARGGQPQ